MKGLTFFRSLGRRRRVVSLATSRERPEPPLKKSFFPYGVASFAGIREYERFFVDKTEGILRLLDEGESVICLRPPRWGKSLTVNILASYLDKNTSDEEFQKLFGDLAIFPAIFPKEKRAKLCGRFYVMKFDLSIDVGDGGVKEIRQRLYDHINSKVKKFARRYELNGVTIYPNNGLASLESAADILSETDPDAELFILVDEYDRFANELMVLPDSSLYRGGGGAGESDVPGKDAGPLRGFLTTIKSLSGILPTRSFVTGLTPISLADASSANIFETISFEQSVAGAFGFTEDDVNAGLSELKHLSIQEQQLAFDFMTEFFNGHLYSKPKDEASKPKLYNPQLSIKFFKLLCTDEGPLLLGDWRDGRASIEDLVARVDDPNTRVSESALALLAKSPLTLQDIAFLTAGGSIETKFSDLTKPFKLSEMTRLPSGDDEELNVKQRAHMLAFMFAHGIVTFDTRINEKDRDLVYLRVPNKVVLSKLLESILERLQLVAEDVNTAFQEPTANKLQEYFEPVLKTLGPMLNNHFGEDGVQGIFAATLREAMKSLPPAVRRSVRVESVQKGGAANKRDGFSDLLVIVGDDAILIELKRVRPNAVCNNANKKVHPCLNDERFLNGLGWRRDDFTDFYDALDTLAPAVLEGLTVYFEGNKLLDKYLLYGGKKGADLTVADYFQGAKKQVLGYQSVLIGELEQNGHTTRLHTFSAVQIGRSILVKPASEPIKITQKQPTTSTT